MLDLSGIVSDSIVDGPGIRVTVFSQGCPHHCPGCHNPETWDFGCGTQLTVQQVLEIVQSNPLCRGVTFSGGEPFAQAEGFAELARLLKCRGYEVASYTGYTFEQLYTGTPAQRQLLETIDVLIDGPFLMAEKSMEVSFRGSKNQRILDVPASLVSGIATPVTSPRWMGEYA
ncbi:MAG: anaerobic ribonucleoside-triphosphate reductase activating protein [Ruminococcaceae bacterium]|nr:anaerobic ribonucleoside-triphosphate reductase activating protein [Oscillospiraceae bacterium]